MFKFDTRPTFTADVDVKLPDGSTEDFKATFIALPIDTFNSFDIGTPEGAEAFLVEAFKDADDIVGEAETPVRFTDGLKADLINSLPVRKALIRAYLEKLAGN